MRIVCTTDLSEESGAAARLTAQLVDQLRRSGNEAEVDVLHVLKPEWFRLDRGSEPLSEDPDNVARLKTEIGRWFDELVEFDGWEVVLREGKPADEIATHTELVDADVLVMGQTGTGVFARMQLGSTAHKLAQNPPCELWLAHRDFSSDELPGRVLAGIELEGESEHVLGVAADAARLFGAELDLVYVIEPPRSAPHPGGLIGESVTDDELDAIKEQARADLRALVDRHEAMLDDLSVVSNTLVGSPVRRMLDHARSRKADLICLGRASDSLVERVTLGSVASGVVRHAPCSIVVAPGGE